MNLGPPELLIILLIVVLIFGGSKLPKLARSLGQAQRVFLDKAAEGGKAKRNRPSEAGGHLECQEPAEGAVPRNPAKDRIEDAGSFHDLGCGSRTGGRDQAAHFLADPLSREFADATPRTHAGGKAVAVDLAPPIGCVKAEEAEDAEAILGDAHHH